MSAFRLLAPLAAFLFLGCQDHEYRHEIAGRVLRGGKPVEGAVVQRINDKNEPYGFDDDYRRVTDAEGRFSFVAQGRGPKPLPYAPWGLRVTHEPAERLLEVRAHWSEERTTCYGYCAQGVDIELP